MKRMSVAAAALLACGSAAAQSFVVDNSLIPQGMSNTENVDFGDVDLDGDWDVALAIADKIDRMLLFFGRPDFETVWKAEGQGSATNPEVRKAFDKIWKRIEKTYLEYDHYAAEVRLNGGER